MSFMSLIKKMYGNIYEVKENTAIFLSAGWFRINYILWLKGTVWVSFYALTVIYLAYLLHKDFFSRGFYKNVFFYCGASHLTLSLADSSHPKIVHALFSQKTEQNGHFISLK